MGAIVKRQPILIRMIIVIGVVALGRIAALLGWIPPDWAVSEDRVQDWIDGGLVLLAAWEARRVVTPVAAPRDNQGRVLAPTAIYPPKRSGL
ncbi:hypothetical protein Aple_010870 [Acrocarpospora pleiomorpha]|uniref:Uncharacterized protein n=1 Tax=Acrocarpospora pleiomorpha TaxID=90975 RepID=A0A5M3XBQ9_9ACTN|nr:hypothetical protein [Acrocarpospora pleiomorpha]GES18192.1 hypothetical protein Aple_010870 [Acrocarpospora pleiomorpha]